MKEEFDDITKKELNDLNEVLQSMSDDDVDPKEIENLMEFINTIDESNVNYDSLMKNLSLDFEQLEKEMENFTPKLDVSYKKSNENTIDPKYVYESDSGFDLYSVENMWIHPFSRVLIPTGLHIDIPDGYEIQVRSKSGLALKQGLMVLNSPGTVDQGYLGEIQVILFNTTNEKVKIDKGQKIAQAVLCPVVSGKWVNFILKNELENKDRNENGFGSTGV
jgi:dUTP pyrophosphatase